MVSPELLNSFAALLEKEELESEEIKRIVRESEGEEDSTDGYGEEEET